MGSTKQTSTVQVGWIGYAAFFAAILLFSGIFSSSEGPWKVLDFNVLNGSFGKIQGASSSFTFRGANGTGARDGFLFAFELIPAVILALGLVNVVDGLGGLRAAQKLMSPILKPLLGVPGICALANIANMQSTDAAAGMIKELVDAGEITDKGSINQRVVIARHPDLVAALYGESSDSVIWPRELQECAS